MYLKIDIREPSLITECRRLISHIPIYKDIILETSSLPLGDIIISDGEKDCLIIERKSIRDLAASIKDGRYKEQSYRLTNIEHPNHNIMYLIEGNISSINTFKDKLSQSSIYSAMFSLNYYKGFSVIRSVSLDETAIIICNAVNKMTANIAMEPYYGSAGNNIEPELCEKQYCTVVKKVKRDNITAANIGEIMLCQIPGISAVTAIAILKQFGTFPNLIAYIQEDPECMNGICSVDAHGKSRKISKAAIASIIMYLSS